MKNLSLIKNRIFYIILILFISFGVVGVTLAAANHMEGYLQDIQYIPPQIQGGGQYVDSSPPLPARIASDPVNSATPGDRIGEQMRQRAMNISQSAYLSTQLINASAIEAEIQRVEFWWSPAGWTYMWGGADPGSNITITTSTGETLYAFSDEFGDYATDYPVMLAPGDIITTTAGSGDGSVIAILPEMEANSDSSTDQVLGHIAFPDWEIEIYPEWYEGVITATTDVNGDFSFSIGDIPPQGRGYIRFLQTVGPNEAQAIFHKPFYDLQPAMHANYAHDWIEGNYDPGYQLWITATDSGGAVKGTAHGTTGDPGWGGDTGFATWGITPWDGLQPDLAAGDYVYLSLENGRSASLRLGEIDGTLDVNDDTLEGSLNIPWLTDTVHVDCGVWVENGPGMGFDDIDPNGGTFTCDFGALGWDLLPGMDVGAYYNDPDANQVINVFQDPAPYLRIDMWGQGVPASGNNYILDIHYNNDGRASAPDVTIQAEFTGMDYLADTSGLPHTGTGAPGDPIIWQVGELPVNHQGESMFYVFVQVTYPPSYWIFSSADIDSSLEYYQDDLSRKHSDWSTSTADFSDSELDISKWAWTGAPVPGYEYVYTVHTCNNGSTSSSEVLITDTLPVSTTLVSWWAQEPGWQEVYSNDQELVVRRPTLTGAQCAEVYINVELSEAAYPGMNLQNQAWLWASSDLNPDNNYAVFDHQVGTPELNLHLFSNWVQGQFVPGGMVAFEINYANWGNIPMPGTLLTATIPAGTEFQFAYGWDWSGWHLITPTIVTQDYVVWDIGDFPNGYNEGVGVQLMIDNSTAPGTPLEVEYSIKGDALEVRYDDNVLTYQEIVNGYGANLRVDKHTNWNWNSWDNSARQLWYELRILNIGTEYQENVLVTDTYPISTMVNGCGWNHGPGELLPCEVDEANRQVIFHLDYMNPGDTASAWLSVDLSPDEAGVQGLLFTNQLAITDNDDVNPSDNFDELMSYSGPDVFVQKWLKSGDVLPGELITYTVEFGNQNRWPWNWDWPYGSHITETLPEGTTFVKAIGYWDPLNIWEPESINGQQVVWAWGTMWSDSTWTFDLVVQIGEDYIPESALINTIEAWGDGPDEVDVNPDNNIFVYMLGTNMYRLLLPFTTR